MSLIISIGRYGGFYLLNGYTKRICLGWLAITLVFADIDDILSEPTHE